jgi:biopolymer transport protein ExbD
LILPEATGVPVKKKAEKIEVAISADGHYTVDGNSIGKTDESELMAAIRNGVETKGVVPLIIIADGRAAHQSVVRAMNSAGRLGLVNINISTKVPAGAAQ